MAVTDASNGLPPDTAVLGRPRCGFSSVLLANGYDPGPKRGAGTWDEFLKIHATLWQCDFFSKRVLAPKGFRDLFVLVFRHVETRRVFITPFLVQTQ